MAASREWRHSGLAEETQAFLAGRLVDRLAVSRQVIPAWAALNRLAHADRADLVRLMEGTADWVALPSGAQPPWVAAERFLAGHLLATARTDEALGRLQRAVLVPLELRLIELSKTEHLTSEEVLAAGSKAVDSYHSDV